MTISDLRSLLKYSVLQVWMDKALFFQRPAVFYFEHQGVPFDLFSKQKSREFKPEYLKKVFINNNIICLQELHGKEKCLNAM